MTSQSDRPVVVRPEGRDAELAALDAALGRGGPATVVLEGPEGSGVSVLLDYARTRAVEFGRPTARWPSGAPPPGWSAGDPARTVLCVEEASALDGDAVRAFPADALVVLALRRGSTLADPAAWAALRARASTTVLTLGPLSGLLGQTAEGLPAAADHLLALPPGASRGPSSCSTRQLHTQRSRESTDARSPAWSECSRSR